MRELWKEREREFGCNEVYGGGWVMRLGESVRVQGEERQTKRQRHLSVAKQRTLCWCTGGSVCLRNCTAVLLLS